MAVRLRALVFMLTLLARIDDTLGQTECEKADVMFIIDASGSIDRPQENFRRLKAFLVDVVQAMKIAPNNVRVGAVTYSASASVSFFLNDNNNADDVEDSINNEVVFLGSATNTAAGLRVMREEGFQLSRGDRKDVENIGIVITDGKANIDRSRISEQVRLAQTAGIRLIVVGISSEVDMFELLSMVTDDSRVLTADTYDDISNLLLKDLVALTCDGPINPEKDCPVHADIAFVIDDSTSITWDDMRNWNPRLLGFVKALIAGFPIGFNKTRVAALTFSDFASVEFYLDEHYDEKELEVAVDRIEQSEGETNIYDGLRLMRRELFRETNGDRPDVQNIAIVITDGQANVEKHKIKEEAETSHKAGVEIFAIGITEDTDLNELRSIASDEDYVFTVDDFEGLYGIIDNITASACESIEPPSPNTGTTMEATTPLTTSSATTESDKSTASTSRKPTDGPGPTTDTTKKPTDDPGPTADTTKKPTDGPGPTADTTKKPTDGPGPTAETTKKPTDGPGPTADTTKKPTDGPGPTADTTKKPTDGPGPTADTTKKTTDGPGPTADTTKKPTDGPGPTADTTKKTTDGPGPTADTTKKPTDGPGPTADTTKKPTDGPGPTADTTKKPTDGPGPTADTTKKPTDGPGPTTDTTKKPTDAPEPTIPTTTRKPVKGCTGDDSDVIFVLDASGSVEQRNFDIVLEFVEKIVSELGVDEGMTRVGCITFSDDVDIQFHLDEYDRRDDVIEAVRNIPYARRSTNTAAALRYVREDMFIRDNGDRTSAQDIIIVITDGESNEQDDTLTEARLTRLDGIHIITIGIGDWLDIYELETMASYPYEKNMFHLESFDVTDTIVQPIKDAVCNNYDECEPPPCDGGARCINRINYYECECPPGTSGPNCDKTCDGAVDVIFIMDSSGSIRKTNFRLMIDFITKVVGALDIDNGSGNSGTRVGLITFGDNEKPEFYLDSYTSKSELLGALNVRYTAGTTNTAAALKYTRESMFSSSRGDRPRVQNVAVVITDGRSDDEEDTWREAMLLRQAEVYVIAVGIGRGAKTKELNGIASSPISSNVFMAQDFETLTDDLIDSLSDAICNNGKECDSNPCQNGATCHDLLNGYTCEKCPFDFTGQHCERECTGEMDIVFLLDSSGSIRSARWKVVAEFVGLIIKELDIASDRTQVGLIYWSDDAHVQFHLNDYYSQQDMTQAVQYTPYMGGKTNTASALRLLREEMFQPRNGDRIYADNYAIVITDGSSNIDPEDTIAEAALARVEGIHIMAVAVGKSFINYVELEGIASLPVDKNVFKVHNYTALLSSVDTVVLGTCNDVDECASDPCANGGECDDKLFRYTCDCQFGFTGLNCERACSRQLDVVFVLDLSGSVEDEYRLVITFAKQVIYGLNMNIGTRVGAITYATNVYDQFYMSRYNKREEVINALNFYHRGGRTNCQEALRLMRTEHFTTRRGDRAGVRNVAIVVTDGYSNETPERTIPEAELAKDENIDIFVVALGEGPNYREVNGMSSNPDSIYVHPLKEFDDIEETADNLLDVLCQ